MTDPQPSCSEIAREIISHHLNMLNGGAQYFTLVDQITEALQAKQKTIEELQHKYDLAIEEVDKLARQLDFSETTLRAYESYRIFKQDSFREVDGGAPVKEIDPVKAFEVIEDLKAEVERLGNLVVMEGEPGQERTWRDEALSLITMTEEQQAQLSRLKEILKGRDEALEKIRHCHGMTEDCAKKVGWIIDQALSKTWEEGEK